MAKGAVKKAGKASRGPAGKGKAAQGPKGKGKGKGGGGGGQGKGATQPRDKRGPNSKAVRACLQVHCSCQWGPMPSQEIMRLILRVQGDCGWMGVTTNPLPELRAEG
jgi:hypothetical protein